MCIIKIFYAVKSLDAKCWHKSIMKKTCCKRKMLFQKKVKDLCGNIKRLSDFVIKITVGFASNTSFVLFLKKVQVST